MCFACTFKRDFYKINQFVNLRVENLHGYVPSPVSKVLLLHYYHYHLCCVKSFYRSCNLYLLELNLITIYRWYKCFVNDVLFKQYIFHF